MKRRSTASNSAWPSVGICEPRTIGKITVVTIATPPIHTTTARTWIARAIARSFILSTPVPADGFSINVRYSPESGNGSFRLRCPPCANGRHTAAARASGGSNASYCDLQDKVSRSQLERLREGNDDYHSRTGGRGLRVAPCRAPG